MIKLAQPVSFNKNYKYDTGKNTNIKEIPVIQEQKEFDYSTNLVVTKIFKKELSETPVVDVSNTAEKGQIVYGSFIFNRSTTEFCRPDIDWRDLGKYLKEKYRSIDDIDLHCFASSTGEEAYSLVLALKHAYGDVPIKVNASDIVQARVDFAKEQQKAGISLDVGQFNSLYSRLGMKIDEFKKYFSIADNKNITISSEVMNSVEFSKKNILDSIDDFDKNKPSFVMARNMWPYVDSKYYQEFANELYERLPKGSVVMVGGYDCVGEYQNGKKFPSALIEAGFTPVKRGMGTVCSLLNKERILIYEKN